ncbi:GntR family transcriptional regulator [Ruegeria sp. 2012CJ41-6]|uniref:GntR family transcriptional regulator n=1 Tax=Ruegeria spongiae TaxID=2942209 RepID=A0ABT0Q884_9RHOB|nr:GntR family transcriptional regulator [Ruegeria spongiae]MCL6285079.1 GntR family transcriptional regulator [Ruegeria spongiae]
MTVDNQPVVSRAQRETVQDRIYNEVRNGLMFGQFAPGQKLKLRALAKDAGTSYLPVRDALGRLVAEKALHLLPNRTIAVPELSREVVDDVWRVRIQLEEFATLNAVKNLTKGDLSALNSIQKEMSKKIAKGAHLEQLKSNKAFHFAIYEAARSPVLIGLIENLWLQAGPYISFTRNMKDDSKIHFHEEVLLAIETGDAKSAANAIKSDLMQGLHLIRAMLEEAEANET